MSKNYVVTGFDNDYWNQWGSSFIASLKELAKYKGEIVVVSFGLSKFIQDKLINYGIQVIQGNDTFQSISEFASQNAGIYAVWDADVYFQDNIDEIFELATNQIVVTENYGFYAASSEKFLFLQEVQKMISFLGKIDTDFYDYLSHYCPQIKKIGNTWNYTDVVKLQDFEGKLCINEVCQKVIHPSGVIKKFLTGKNIAFLERYPEIHAEYSAIITRTSRKLVTKKDEND